jgi:hypothetical protein
MKNRHELRHLEIGGRFEEQLKAEVERFHVENA